MERGFSPEGQPPVLPVETKRERVNMVSAISQGGGLRYMIYQDSMNQQKLISFMRRLIANSHRKIFFIMDNLRVHHGKLVQAWLERHKSQIEAFYLPPYAPECNPDEYLNHAFSCIRLFLIVWWRGNNKKGLFIEMSKSYVDIAIGVVGLAASVFGIGYAIGQRKKLNDISEKLDRSVKELSSNIDVDISEAVVNRAVTRAIERETELAASRATANVVSAIESDISGKVRKAVDDTYQDIKKSVVEETAKKVEKIDIAALKKEVVEKAKEAAADKFDDSLDEVLSDFKDNLGNVTKIYQSIANAFPNSNGTSKGISFSLGA